MNWIGGWSEKWQKDKNSKRFEVSCSQHFVNLASSSNPKESCQIGSEAPFARGQCLPYS